MRVASRACRRVAGAAAESRFSRRVHRRESAAANYLGTKTGDIGMAFAAGNTASAERHARGKKRMQVRSDAARKGASRDAGIVAIPRPRTTRARRPATLAWCSRRQYRERRAPCAWQEARASRFRRGPERRLSRRRHRRHSAAANSACYAARATGLPSRAASTVSAPACPDRARHVLSSNAFVTTLTLENAIAAPAYIGSSMPSAASGMPIRL